MYKQEQIKPYEGTGDKGKLVEEMFDNIRPYLRYPEPPSLVGYR